MIGLVPCAVGATSMSKWKKGSFLYNKMILRTKAAIQKGGTLKGLLWCQGESDTINEELGASFALKLATFLQDVRTDLQSKSFPIIQVNLQIMRGLNSSFTFSRVGSICCITLRLVPKKLL